MEEREEEGGVDLGTVLQVQVGHIDVAVLAGVGEPRVARARGGVHPRAVLGEGVKEVEVTEVNLGFTVYKSHCGFLKLTRGVGWKEKYISTSKIAFKPSKTFVNVDQ